MKNETKLSFTDISSELYREYVFAAASGQQVVHIAEPTHLNVSSSGGHRMLDARGVSHYIPAGWIRLSWKAKPGSPNFVA